MKRRLLILPFLTLTIVLVLTLLPVSFISANPDNLVQNSGFSEGSDGLDYWTPRAGDVTVIYDGISKRARLGSTNPSYIEQLVDTSSKDLTYSLIVRAGSLNGPVSVGFQPDGSSSYVENMYYSLSTDDYTSISFKLSDWWNDKYATILPDYTQMWIWVETWGCTAYFDDIMLQTPGGGKVAEEPVWVRTQEMTCKQVWINEDNKFQFSFIYPYRDNNWVKIYDMSGKEVYSIDMPYDNPNIIVDLPNGMYTVKTFNVDPATPIQTFVIGKP